MFGGYCGSRPGIRGAWPHGDVKDVSAEDAEYLLSTFPADFHAVAEPKPEPAPVKQERAAYTADRIQPAGPAVILNGPVRDLRPAIESGDYDDCLAGLIRAEEAGDNRVTVLRALKARARSIVSSPMADAGEE